MEDNIVRAGYSYRKFLLLTKFKQKLQIRTPDFILLFNALESGHFRSFFL